MASGDVRLQSVGVTSPPANPLTLRSKSRWGLVARLCGRPGRKAVALGPRMARTGIGFYTIVLV